MHGVENVLTKRASKSLLSRNPMLLRPLTARLTPRYGRSAVTSTDKEKDELYEQLQKVLDSTPRYDTRLPMADLNMQRAQDHGL